MSITPFFAYNAVATGPYPVALYFEITTITLLVYTQCFDLLSGMNSYFSEFILLLGCRDGHGGCVHLRRLYRAYGRMNALSVL